MKLPKMPFVRDKVSVLHKMGKVRLGLMWNVFVLVIALGLVHGTIKDQKALNAAALEKAESIMAMEQLKADLETVKAELEKSRAALAEVKKKPQAETPSAKEEKSDVPEKPKPLVVESTSYNSRTTFVLHFSAPPDKDVLREYIKVSPVNGAIGINTGGGSQNPYVEITGDFLYRTNITLRVRAGLPAGKDSGATPLASDFTTVFRRADANPQVVFADKGRYLPPDGKRLIAVSSVNVTNLYCAVARVPPANIVQILAREEGIYESGRVPADGDNTFELADIPRESTISTGFRPNESCVSFLDVKSASGSPSNGVYLAAVRRADVPRTGFVWWGGHEEEDYNPLRCRLVCITDIGLTVRQTSRKLHVWATSLLKGTPVAGCRVTVYSSGNVRMGSGVTGKNGLVSLVRRGGCVPFAVVAESSDGSDVSFMALSGGMEVESTGAHKEERPFYLSGDDFTAFAWTERGIYRHGEKIFFHAILRNGKGAAPKPFPVELRLETPDGRVEARKTIMPDSNGALKYEDFSVPADRPGGRWKIVVGTPGSNYAVERGETSFSVEEFAPPQIRVKVEAKGETPADFGFSVSAEHLFGGPARLLRSEGAVLFMDHPFAPAKWPGYKFGDAKRGLKPNFRRLSKTVLDNKGHAVFSAPLLSDTGSPKAAVRVIGQGTVFEDGGRPASARTEKILHSYPYYIGVKMGDTVRIPENGFAQVSIACVLPDGRRLPEKRKLEVSFKRIENVYSSKSNPSGWSTWICDRVEVPCSDAVAVETGTDRDVPFAVPFREGGDYIMIVRDTAADVAFSSSFWLSTWGDETVRAPMADPSKISVTPDKEFYRVGERPRLVIKSPFAGHALVAAVREEMVYCESLLLTNATAELMLPAVSADWAPNVDVSVCVVRKADGKTARQSVRARGTACISVRPIEREIPVKVSSAVKCNGENGSVLTADVSAVSPSAIGTVAVVTVVDEGINLLTGRKTPDPVGFFARPRMGINPVWDLFGRLLPITDENRYKIGGVRTGGGFGEHLLGRVSPMPSRRFRPLALWQAAVPLKNGKGRAVFNLPEFVGEVRVTAVAFSPIATGAASVQQKVVPKLVVQSDAPRFAAPEDVFDATLTLTDRSGKGSEVNWEVTAFGAVRLEKKSSGKIILAKDGFTNVTVRVTAGSVPGQGTIRFRAAGSGETHVRTIEIPVRPAVAARETGGAICLAPGKSHKFPRPDSGVPEATVRTFVPAASPLAELSGALTWLADYPHGCLEQTVSRIFPLVAAGGLLNTLTDSAEKNASDRNVYVNAGVRRVMSMIRAKDFVMWPDCNYAPHDREVSLYAAHFLVEANASGTRVEPAALKRVTEFLSTWSGSTNDSFCVYAVHTLALAGKPNRDLMFRLHDIRGKLPLLDRARLARAFAKCGDRTRAADLLKSGVDAPASVKEAAFAVLALLDIDPADPRLPRLVQWLSAKRDSARFSWGTTCENAHALIAMASYYRHHPFKEGKPELVLASGKDAAVPLRGKTRRIVKGGDEVTVSNSGTGDAWFTWRQVDLPRPETVTNEASHISVSRRYLTGAGDAADLSAVERGDLLIAEITVTFNESRSIEDLVIQDLFPAGLEPIHDPIDPSVYPWYFPDAHDWVMRYEARDDRMLVFSKAFNCDKDKTVVFYYPLRAVSSGSFILPGTAVEAMYAPAIRAVNAPSRFNVAR